MTKEVKPKKITKKTFREAVDRVWPKTKKDLQNVSKNAKILLAKGEKYLREVSGKGARHTKKLSLNLKKEKIYHDLGKAVANIPCDKWAESKKINDCLSAIKKIERQVRSIKI